MIELQTRKLVYDDINQLLSEETLSDLLSQRVTRINLRPMENHRGVAGGKLSYVDTDAGRFVLKRSSIEYDWIMYATDDYRGRSVRLWQYGMLDQLSPHIEPIIIASARDGDGWALLMKDLGDSCFTKWDFPARFVPVFLDTLAKIHATFWDDPRLLDSRIGLADPAAYLNHYLRSKRHLDSSRGVIPEWIRIGWKTMETLLDESVFQRMVSLHESPEPLLNALSRHPCTVVHGDYRPDNLAYLQRPVVFDWQQSARCLMTVDLAWYSSQHSEVMSREIADQYYRTHLERYLNQQFDDAEWEEMVDLGYAIDALRWTCLSAFAFAVDDTPGNKERHEKRVRQKAQWLMQAYRWM